MIKQQTMSTGLLHTHSFLRYLVLIMLLAVIVNSMAGVPMRPRVGCLIVTASVIGGVVGVSAVMSAGCAVFKSARRNEEPGI